MLKRSLSDQALHEETLLASKREKAATLELLEYLLEVESRMLYAKRGYPSLWKYVESYLGYSPSQTSERISAMRLMQKVPAVRAMLMRNELTLTSTIKVASFVKREKTSIEETSALLSAVSGKSVTETEAILAERQSVPIPAQADFSKPKSLEVTRYAFDGDAEFRALYEEMVELRGFVRGSGDSGQSGRGFQMQDHLKAAMRLWIERKRAYLKTSSGKGFKSKASDKGLDFSLGKGAQSQDSKTEKPTKEELEKESKRGSSGEKKSVEENADGGKKALPLQNTFIHPVSSVSPSSRLRSTEVRLLRSVSHSRKTSRSRTIPRNVARQVRERSGGICEFTDPLTGKRCESRFSLEFDHHPIPFALGGANTLQNLRHACPAHNQLHAMQVFRPACLTNPAS